MNIVFIGHQKIKYEKIAGDLELLGQEIIVYSGKKLLPLSVLMIPFKLRTGDIYFYHGGKFLEFMMKLAQNLLNKPVLPFSKMPKGIKEFEKRCYKEYARYFR